MSSAPASDNALGEFLKARRAQVAPADVGLPPGHGRRRTPGLRREELATLAGVSVDYYTRLERGRERHPSHAVLDALAETLLLNPDERAYLCGLATRGSYRRRNPDPRPDAAERLVRPGTLRLLEALRPNPVYVVNRVNDLIAANRPGLRLIAGMDEWPAERRNMTRYLFLHPAAHTLYRDHAKLLPSSVAHLRALAGADPDAPDLVRLVGELAVKSSDFARLWERHDVRARTDGTKRFRHPEVGDLDLGYEVMSLDGTDGARMVAYHAEPGTPDHDAMVLLDMDSPSAPAREADAEPFRRHG
ncbi:transcriptional regulator [Mangrovactinospora gilvigrisea]|uniref:Transcriptional regulator n=1 Tax=Mangrovactinospora gilvigrisea TaxID=1428644 RepID=A0A1J7BGU3_9ACTN|nr:helix-turn-helix transcriptional regulator [Mangrovactinospora gilvigrisea]OIV37789.1 transcriptional regulator [Mangrovactinospora gilvigrisea]